MYINYTINLPIGIVRASARACVLFTCIRILYTIPLLQTHSGRPGSLDAIPFETSCIVGICKVYKNCTCIRTYACTHTITCENLCARARACKRCARFVNSRLCNNTHTLTQKRSKNTLGLTVRTSARALDVHDDDDVRSRYIITQHKSD